MSNLNTIEIKTFVPAKDFELSKQFYQDLGFAKGSDSDGIAYFYRGNCSFLLQDFYEPTHSENFMMHLLVEDVQVWHQHIYDSEILSKYKTKMSELIQQPWGMLDFTIYDPSRVMWRIAQNI